MTFLVVSMFYLVAMILVDGSVRTYAVMGFGYLCILMASIAYDGGSQMWQFWLLLTGVLTILTAVSIRHDREQRELQDWMDS